MEGGALRQILCGPQILGENQFVIGDISLAIWSHITSCCQSS